MKPKKSSNTLIYVLCAVLLTISACSDSDSKAMEYTVSPTEPGSQTSPNTGGNTTNTDNYAYDTAESAASPNTGTEYIKVNQDGEYIYILAPITESDTDSSAFDPEEEILPILEMAWFQLSPDDSTSMATAQILKLENIYAHSSFPLLSHEVINYYDPPAQYRLENDLAHQWTTEEDIFIGLDGQLTASDKMEILVHVYAPQVPVAQRKPWNLHLCIDVSGSMAGDRIAYTKKALLKLVDAMNNEDKLSITTFDTNGNLLLETASLSNSRDNIVRIINNINASGSTNMKAGLDKAYDQAQKAHDPSYINRVILFSDGHANVGPTDLETFANLTRMNNQEGIYLSGVGVGNDYALARMNELTDAGKGAHVFLPNEKEVDIVFGPMLRKLIEVAADEISIEVELPLGFALDKFSGEESSTNPQQRVQNVVLAAGDDMTLLATFVALEEELFDGDMILTFRYTPLSTGEEVVFTKVVSIESLLRDNPGSLMERTRLVNDYANFAIPYSQIENEINGEDLLERVTNFIPQDNGLAEIAQEISRRL